MTKPGLLTLTIKDKSALYHAYMPFIENAINIPLYFIRLKLKALNKETKYVVYCDTGRRSSAAAYILSERGYEAFVLTGGLGSRG